MATQFFGPVQGLYQEAISNANRRFESLLKENRLTVDKFINPYKYMSGAELVGTAAGSFLYDLVNGAGTSISSVLTTGVQIFADLYTDISRIVNTGNQQDMMDAFGDALVRVGNNTLTFAGTLGATVLGVGAEVATLGLADTGWATDYIKNLKVLNKQYTVNATEGTPIPFSNQTAMFTGNVLADAALMDSENPVLKNAYVNESEYDKKFNERFTADMEKIIKGSLSFKKAFDKDIVGSLTTVLGLKSSKELANTIWGDNTFYQQFSGILDSIGSILAAQTFARVSATTGLFTPEQSAQLASIYFAGKVFGSAFEEAIDNGASLSDAYTFAYSNALIETAVEQIGGIRLGVSQQMVPTTLQAFLKNGFEEGIEEIMSEFTTPGFDIYRGQNAIAQEGELPRLTGKGLFERMFFAYMSGAVAGGIFGATNQFLFNQTLEGRSMLLRDAFRQDFEKVGKERALQRLKVRLKQFLAALNSPNTKGVKQKGRGVSLQVLTVQDKIQFVRSAGLANIIDVDITKFDRLGSVGEDFDAEKLDDLLNGGYFAFVLKPDVVLDETIFNPQYENQRVTKDQYAINNATAGERLNNARVGETEDKPYRLTPKSEINDKVGKISLQIAEKSNIPMVIVSSRDTEQYNDYAFYLNGVIYLNQDADVDAAQIQKEIRKHELIHLLSAQLPLFYSDILEQIQQIIRVDELVKYDGINGFSINTEANIGKELADILKGKDFFSLLQTTLNDIVEQVGGQENLQKLFLISQDSTKSAEVRQQAQNRIRVITETIAAAIAEEASAYFVEFMVKDSAELTNVIEKMGVDSRNVFSRIANVVNELMKESRFNKLFKKAFPDKKEGFVTVETKEGKKQVVAVGETKTVLKGIERTITKATQKLIEKRSRLEYLYREFFPTREDAARFINPTILKKYNNDIDLIFDSLKSAIDGNPFAQVMSIKGDQYNIKDVFRGDFTAPRSKKGKQKSSFEKFMEEYLAIGEADEEILTNIVYPSENTLTTSPFQSADTSFYGLLKQFIQDANLLNNFKDYFETYSFAGKDKTKNFFYHIIILERYYDYLNLEITALFSKVGDETEEEAAKTKERIATIKKRQVVVNVMKAEMHALLFANLNNFNNTLSSYLEKDTVVREGVTIQQFLSDNNAIDRSAGKKSLFFASFWKAFGERFGWTVSSTGSFYQNNRDVASIGYAQSFYNDVILNNSNAQINDVFAFESNYPPEVMEALTDFYKNIISQSAFLSEQKEVRITSRTKNAILASAEYSLRNIQKVISKKNVTYRPQGIEEIVPKARSVGYGKSLLNLKQAGFSASKRLLQFIQDNKEKLPGFMASSNIVNSGYSTESISNPGGLTMDIDLTSEMEGMSEQEKIDFVERARETAEIFIHTFLEGEHVKGKRTTRFGLENYNYEVDNVIGEDYKTPVGISIFIYPTENILNKYIEKIRKTQEQTDEVVQINELIISSDYKVSLKAFQDQTSSKANDLSSVFDKVITDKVFPLVGEYPQIIQLKPGEYNNIKKFFEGMPSPEDYTYAIFMSAEPVSDYSSVNSESSNLLLTGYLFELVSYEELLEKQRLLDEAVEKNQTGFSFYFVRLEKENLTLDSETQHIDYVKPLVNPGYAMLSFEDTKEMEFINYKVASLYNNMYDQDFNYQERNFEGNYQQEAYEIYEQNLLPQQQQNKRLYGAPSWLVDLFFINYLKNKNITPINLDFRLNNVVFNTVFTHMTWEQLGEKYKNVKISSDLPLVSYSNDEEFDLFIDFGVDSSGAYFRFASFLESNRIVPYGFQGGVDNYNEENFIANNDRVTLQGDLSTSFLLTSPEAMMQVFEIYEKNGDVNANRMLSNDVNFRYDFMKRYFSGDIVDLPIEVIDESQRLRKGSHVLNIPAIKLIGSKIEKELINMGFDSFLGSEYGEILFDAAYFMALNMEQRLKKQPVSITTYISEGKRLNNIIQRIFEPRAGREGFDATSADFYNLVSEFNDDDLFLRHNDSLGAILLKKIKNQDDLENLILFLVEKLKETNAYLANENDFVKVYNGYTANKQSGFLNDLIKVAKLWYGFDNFDDVLEKDMRVENNPDKTSILNSVVNALLEGIVYSKVDIAVEKSMKIDKIFVKHSSSVNAQRHQYLAAKYLSETLFSFGISQKVSSIQDFGKLAQEFYYISDNLSLDGFMLFEYIDKVNTYGENVEFLEKLVLFAFTNNINYEAFRTMRIAQNKLVNTASKYSYFVSRYGSIQDAAIALDNADSYDILASDHQYNLNIKTNKIPTPFSVLLQSLGITQTHIKSTNQYVISAYKDLVPKDMFAPFGYGEYIGNDANENLMFFSGTNPFVSMVMLERLSTGPRDIREEGYGRFVAVSDKQINITEETLQAIDSLVKNIKILDISTTKPYTEYGLGYEVMGNRYDVPTVRLSPEGRMLISSVDSNGRILSPRQTIFFKDVHKFLRDANGNIKSLWHGSKVSFNEFSYTFLGNVGMAYGIGFYFAESKGYSQTYTHDNSNKILVSPERGESRVLTEEEQDVLKEVYLNIKKPIFFADGNDLSTVFRKQEIIDIIVSLLEKEVDSEGYISETAKKTMFEHWQTFLKDWEEPDSIIMTYSMKEKWTPKMLAELLFKYSDGITEKDPFDPKDRVSLVPGIVMSTLNRRWRTYRFAKFLETKGEEYKKELEVLLNEQNRPATVRGHFRKSIGFTMEERIEDLFFKYVGEKGGVKKLLSRISSDDEKTNNVIYRNIFGNALREITEAVYKATGYDGIYNITDREGSIVIAFFPNQIKSVENVSPTEDNAVFEYDEDLIKETVIEELERYPYDPNHVVYVQPPLNQEDIRVFLKNGFEKGPVLLSLLPATYIDSYKLQSETFPEDAKLIYVERVARNVMMLDNKDSSQRTPVNAAVMILVDKNDPRFASYEDLRVVKKSVRYETNDFTYRLMRNRNKEEDAKVFSKFTDENGNVNFDFAVPFRGYADYNNKIKPVQGVEGFGIPANGKYILIKANTPNALEILNRINFYNLAKNGNQLQGIGFSAEQLVQEYNRIKEEETDPFEAAFDGDVVYKRSSRKNNKQTQPKVTKEELKDAFGKESVFREFVTFDENGNISIKSKDINNAKPPLNILNINGKTYDSRIYAINIPYNNMPQFNIAEKYLPITKISELTAVAKFYYKFLSYLKIPFVMFEGKARVSHLGVSYGKRIVLLNAKNVMANGGIFSIFIHETTHELFKHEESLLQAYSHEFALFLFEVNKSTNKLELSDAGKNFFALTHWGKDANGDGEAGFNLFLDYMRRSYKKTAKFLNPEDIFYLLRTPNSVIKAEKDGDKKYDTKNEITAQLTGELFGDADLVEYIFKVNPETVSASKSTLSALTLNIYTQLISNPNLDKQKRLYIKLSLEEYRNTMNAFIAGLQLLYPTEKQYTVASINAFISQFTDGKYTTKKQLIEKYSKERINKERGDATETLDKIIYVASLLEKTAQAGATYYKELKNEFIMLQESVLYLLNLDNTFLTKMKDITSFAGLAKVVKEAEKIKKGIESGKIIIDRYGKAIPSQISNLTPAQLQDTDYEVEDFLSRTLDTLYDIAEIYHETPEEIHKIFNMTPDIDFQIRVSKVVAFVETLVNMMKSDGIINASRLPMYGHLLNELNAIINLARPYINTIDLIKKENFDAANPSPQAVQAGVIALRTKLEQSNMEVLQIKFKQKISSSMNRLLSARLQKESPTGDPIQKLNVIFGDMSDAIANEKLSSVEIGKILFEQTLKAVALAQNTFLKSVEGIKDPQVLQGIDKRWQRILKHAEIALAQSALMQRNINALDSTYLASDQEKLTQIKNFFEGEQFNPGAFAGAISGLIDAFAKRYPSAFDESGITNDEYTVKLQKAIFDFMKSGKKINNETLKLWQSMTPQDFLSALRDYFAGTEVDFFEKILNLYIESSIRAENIAAEFHRDYVDFIKANPNIQKYSYETEVVINEDILVNIPSGVLTAIKKQVDDEYKAKEEEIAKLKENLAQTRKDKKDLLQIRRDLVEERKKFKRGSLEWINVRNKIRSIDLRKSALSISIQNQKTILDNEKVKADKKTKPEAIRQKILEYLASNPVNEENQKMNKGEIIALYLSVSREIEMLSLYEAAKQTQEYTEIRPTNHFQFLNQVNIFDNEILRNSGFDSAKNSMSPFTILATDKKEVQAYLLSLLDDPRDMIIMAFAKKVFDRNYIYLNEIYSQKFLEELIRQDTYIPFTTPNSSYERDFKTELAGRYNIGVPDGLVSETTIGAATFLKIENIFAVVENHVRSTAKYSYERFITDFQNILVNKTAGPTTLQDLFSMEGGAFAGQNNPFLKYFQQMMIDVLAYRDITEPAVEKLFKKVLRIYRGRTLFLSVGSFLRQFASIMTVLIKSRGWNKKIEPKTYIRNFISISTYREKYYSFLSSRSGNFYFRTVFGNIPDLAKSIDTALGVQAQNVVEKIIDFGAKPAGRADANIIIAAFKTITDAIRQENPNLTEEEAMEQAIEPTEKNVLLYGVANTNKAFRSHFSNSNTFLGQYASKFQSENILQWSSILRYWWELKNGVAGANRELLLQIFSLFMSGLWSGVVGAVAASLLGYYDAEDDVLFETLINEVLWGSLVGSIPLVNMFTQILQFDQQTIVRPGFEPTLPGISELAQVVNILSTGLFYKDSGQLNYRKVLKLFGELLAPLGIPLKNIERLVRLSFGIGSGLGLDFAREGLQWFSGQTDAQALTAAIKRGDRGAIEYYINQVFENETVQKEILRLALSDKNIRFSFKNENSFIVVDKDGNRVSYKVSPADRSFYSTMTMRALRRLFQSGQYRRFSNEEKAKVTQRLINYFWNYMKADISGDRKRFSSGDLSDLVRSAIEYERRN